MNLGTREERAIGKIDVLKLSPGETVRIVSPGGGGYGDPVERDPELVRQDVANGFVTLADAAERYGVVLHDGAVDGGETRRRRERRASAAAEFGFGPERDLYERRLPPAVQDAVAAELLGHPGSYRHFLKEQVYEALEANGPAGLDPVALRERVRAILKSIQLGAAAERGTHEDARGPAPTA